MIHVTIGEAQQRLPDLLAAVEAGEVVTIHGDHSRTFTVTAQAASPPVNPDWPGYPHAGSAKGLIGAADGFEEPLEELREYME